MRPLKADYGILYNGLQLIFFKRVGSEYESRFSTRTDELSEAQIKQLVQFLAKPDYSTTDIELVLDYFKGFDEPEERLKLVEEQSREHFFQNFQLEKDSAFGDLLQQTLQLFKHLEEQDNRFLTSAYDFWKRAYSKNPDTIPESWKPLMEAAGLSEDEEDLYQFMFCLETAYAIFARLILAKSAEDYNFPDVRFRDFIEKEMRDASRRGDIAQSAWAMITEELIDDLQQRLVSSVFEEDIFYWWTEAFEDRSYHDLFGRETTLEMSSFGASLAKLLLMMYKFNFAEIRGDPLGILYQRYFDKETRKALGEFYTPQEVVDYILDAVEYDGRQVVEKRLLDPACGSGTFPVTALQRYLDASEERAKEEGWDTVLDDLCNKYRIVGFDVHPFATIMAQIQFMLVLLEPYKKAIEDAEEKGDHFVLQRIPIFRTDSLKKESESGEMDITEWLGGEKFSMSIKLPVQGKDDKDFFKHPFDMPTPLTARKKTDLHNNEEYFGALQGLFDVVKEQAQEIENAEIVPKFDEKRFKRRLKQYYLSDKNWDQLSEFFEPFANDLLEQINRLQSEFDDGRLVKSIEDIFLAALLKTQKYDYVVGNPPYVRRRIFESEEDPCEEWFTPFGSFDIFVPFVERGVRWLEPDGKLGYITSNKYFVKDYGKKLRPFILQNCRINELLDLSFAPDVFERPSVYAAITILERTNSKITAHSQPKECVDNETNVKILLENKKEALSNIGNYQCINKRARQDRFLNNENHVFDVFAVGFDDVLSKLENNTKPISKGWDVSGGYMGWEYREAEEHIVTEEKPNTRKILPPSLIEPYRILWGEKSVRLFKKKFDVMYIEKYPEMRDSLWELFTSEKLIVRGIAKQCSAVYDNEGHGLLVNVFGINNETADDSKYLFLEGVLNSELANFYHLVHYYLGRIPEGSLDYPKPFWEGFPLTQNTSKEVVQNVRNIKDLKALKKKKRSFPEDYLCPEVEVSLYNLRCRASHTNMSPDVQKRQDGGFNVVIGSRKKEDPFVVDTREKAEYVRKALEGENVSKGETVEVLVPKKNSVVKDILGDYEEDQRRLKEGPSVADLEEEINEIVYTLYDLDEEDREVIEEFLDNF